MTRPANSKNFTPHITSYFRYQKYLYDYECEREHLSTQADLQAAIEGNKREGRRSNVNGAVCGAPNPHFGRAPGGGGHQPGGAGPAQAVPGFPYSLVPHSAAAAAMSTLFSKHLNSFMNNGGFISLFRD